MWFDTHTLGANIFKGLKQNSVFSICVTGPTIHLVLQVPVRNFQWFATSEAMRFRGKSQMLRSQTHLALNLSPPHLCLAPNVREDRRRLKASVTSPEKWSFERSTLKDTNRGLDTGEAFRKSCRPIPTPNTSLSKPFSSIPRPGDCSPGPLTAFRLASCLPQTCY